MVVLAGILAIGIMLALLAATALLTLIILWLAGWSERKWQRRRRGGSDSPLSTHRRRADLSDSKRRVRPGSTR